MSYRKRIDIAVLVFPFLAYPSIFSHFCRAKFMASAFRFSSASDDRGDKFVLRHPDTEYNINMKQVPIFWYENVRSTMDSARNLINSPLTLNETVFGVVARSQSKGRGTHGRAWISSPNNLFLTVVVRSSCLPEYLPMTLIPLRIGTLVGATVNAWVTSGGEVKLKWPNDVLINEEKVCGVLMEMSDNCLLIGIGCNVLSAPSAAAAARDGGRPPTSLSHHNTQMQAFLLNQPASPPPEEQLLPAKIEEEEALISLTGEVQDSVPKPISDITGSLAEGDFYKVLATEICSSIQRWVVSGDDTTEAVVADFQRNMGYSLHKIRDQQTAMGAHVIPLRINNDGTLQVRVVDDGTEKTLIAEYLW